MFEKNQDPYDDMTQVKKVLWTCLAFSFLAVPVFDSWFLPMMVVNALLFVFGYELAAYLC